MTPVSHSHFIFSHCLCFPTLNANLLVGETLQGTVELWAGLGPTHIFFQ